MKLKGDSWPLVMISSQVWWNRSLNALDKCVLTKLDADDDILSDEDLAEFFSTSVEEIQKSIQKLMDHGYMILKSENPRIFKTSGVNQWAKKS